MTYEMTDADFSLYSDMHKDAHGFRPHINSLIKFQTKEEFDSEIEFLQIMIEDSIISDRFYEDASYDRWIASVHKTARDTGNTVATIVRWMFDAEGLRLSSKDDRESFCYDNGFLGLCHLVEKIR